MDGYPEFSMTADFFSLWIMDHETGEFTAELQSGEVIHRQVSIESGSGLRDISKTVFNWNVRLITLVTSQNDKVHFEPHWPEDPDPVHGRPVVYLDQNHWNTVRQVMAGQHDLAKEPEAMSAHRLIDLAQDDGIILPLSSGHLRETTPLTGQRRYEQGVAMANFSAGWQMRHPSRILRDEHVRMLGTELGMPIPDSATKSVFTLEPRALFDRVLDTRNDAADERGSWALIMSNPSITFQLLVDTAVEASGSSDTWVVRNQTITDHLASSELSGKEKRFAALDSAWNENCVPAQEALTLLGANPSLRSAFNAAQQAKLLRSQPFMRNLADLFVQRHLDSMTVWKPNDRIDLWYLCCAAGYADYVVAEKHTGHQLIRAQKARGEPVTVHVTLKSVVDALNEAGVRTATERAARET